MKTIVINSSDYNSKYKANRNKYTILEFNWSDFTEDEKQNIYKEANLLYEKASDISANTGLQRTCEKKYIDSLCGVISEFATIKFFNVFLNDNWSAYRPIFTKTHNQIDISLKYKERSYKVEVRSSFVQNGIAFALYGINKNNDKTYFDVLGTYKQENNKKDFEPIKDLFMRVLFDIQKESSDNFKNDRNFYKNRIHFINKYINKNEPFYIIGGLSGDRIIKEKYTKSLTPKELSQYASNIKEGEYNVAQISNIYDIEWFSNL